MSEPIEKVRRVGILPRNLTDEHARKIASFYFTICKGRELGDQDTVPTADILRSESIVDAGMRLGSRYSMHAKLLPRLDYTSSGKVLEFVINPGTDEHEYPNLADPTSEISLAMHAMEERFRSAAARVLLEAGVGIIIGEAISA